MQAVGEAEGSNRDQIRWEVRLQLRRHRYPVSSYHDL